MNISALLDALILGVVQGLTEFLPVSSSGHLVIAQGYLSDLGQKAMAFDVVLHLGTLLAVLCYFRRDVGTFLYLLAGKEPKTNPFPVRAWFWLIILATIPTGIVGLGLERNVEPLYESPAFAAAALIVNGTVLLLTTRAPSARREAFELGSRDALIIGFMQGLSILPGISRSGATIATALFLGVRKETAARFSFLIAIPAIAGAVLVKSRDLQGVAPADLIPLCAGVAVALVTGLWAIAFLLRTLTRGKFQYFGYYCVALGGAVLLLRIWEI